MAVVAAALVRSLAEELARGARELGGTLVAGQLRVDLLAACSD